MALSNTDYRQQLLALLPPSDVLDISDGSQLWSLLDAMSAELARVDGRADDLLRELDPRSASELLNDWEIELGLPDACAPLAISLVERRNAAHAKLTGRGGQSIAYFTAIAESLGYYIEIEETRPFVIGSLAGEKLWATPFVWYVHTLRATIRTFSIGSIVGDALRAWGNTLLECAINKDAPAHARPLFVYDINQVPSVNAYLRAGDRAGAGLHTWSGPYTYKRSI